MAEDTQVKDKPAETAAVLTPDTQPKGLQLLGVQQDIMSGIDAEMMKLIEADAGKGLEKMTSKDVALPFIAILQGLHPQVQPGGPKYVEGAQQGMIINTLTNELWNGQEGILAVLCYWEKKWNLWRKRLAGGGLLGVYNDEDEAKAAAEVRAKETDEKRRVSIDNVDIIETAGHFLLVQDHQQRWQPALFPLKRAMLPMARVWAAMYQDSAIKHPTRGEIPVASFTFVYSITTIPTTKPGGTFYTPVFERVGIAPKDVYKRASRFYEEMTGGKVKYTYEDADTPDEHAPAAEANTTERPKF